MTECAVCFQVFLVFCSSLFIRLFVLSYSIVFLFLRLWRSLGITMEASHVTRAGLSSGFSSSILAYLRSFGHPKCKTVRVKSQHVRMEVRFHITTPNIRRTSQRADLIYHILHITCRPHITCTSQITTPKIRRTSQRADLALGDTFWKFIFSLNRA